MMTKVLITGANGFLATNVIIELLSRGYLVRGLLRNLNSYTYGQHPNLELLQGDFTDKDFFQKSVSGCDYVIHTAAITDQSLARYADYHRVNVTAVEDMITIAISGNIKRFVYVSSANAFGHGSKVKPGNEQMPVRKPFTDSNYAMSKVYGQQLVLAHKDKIDVVVLNPSFMLGPYDSEPSSGRIILMGYGKSLVLYPPGGKNFVHVSDAAAGVVKAMEKGKNGEAYLLVNENLSYREFFLKLSEVTGIKTVLIKIPGLILLLAGFFGNLARFLGFKTNLSMANMRILCTNGFYSNQKAVNELGANFQNTEKAIKDAIDWFAEKKMISIK